MGQMMCMHYITVLLTFGTVLVLFSGDVEGLQAVVTQWGRGWGGLMCMMRVGYGLFTGLH